jgi:hypothetical protein
MREIEAQTQVRERFTMKVSELIDRLRAFDPNAEVYVPDSRRNFASSIWVGMMHTAGLFDQEKDLQLVISPWEPGNYRRPESDEQKARRKVLAELVAYDQDLGLTDKQQD